MIIGFCPQDNFNFVIVVLLFLFVNIVLLLLALAEWSAVCCCDKTVKIKCSDPNMVCL